MATKGEQSPMNFYVEIIIALHLVGALCKSYIHQDPTLVMKSETEFDHLWIKLLFPSTEG